MAVEAVAGTPEGGSPAPSPSPEGNKPAPSSPDAKSTPQPDPAPGKGGEEDRRFKGIQADLAKERKTRQEFEAKVRDYEAKLQEQNRRVAALAGVNVPSPEEAEAEEIRKRFGQVFTREHLLEFLGLSEEDIEELQSSRESRGQVNDLVQRQWQRHGQTFVDSVAKDISAEIGAELSERQKGRLIAGLVNDLQSDPALLERYEAGDPALIKEYAQQWIEDWIKPAARKATANEVDRSRRVPSGKDRSFGQTGEKKIDVTDDKAVADLLVRGFKERGGQFRR